LNSNFTKWNAASAGEFEAQPREGKIPEVQIV
jgi:hypothetical protein